MNKALLVIALALLFFAVFQTIQNKEQQKTNQAMREFTEITTKAFKRIDSALVDQKAFNEHAVEIMVQMLREDQK